MDKVTVKNEVVLAEENVGVVQIADDVEIGRAHV